jgi:hypothetical protein
MGLGVSIAQVAGVFAVLVDDFARPSESYPWVIAASPGGICPRPTPGRGGARHTSRVASNQPSRPSAHQPVTACPATRRGAATRVVSMQRSFHRWNGEVMGQLLFERAAEYFQVLQQGPALFRLQQAPQLPHCPACPARNSWPLLWLPVMRVSSTKPPSKASVR